MREVHVPVEVVGQEAQAHFQGHQPGAVGQGFQLQGRQGAARGGEEPVGVGLEQPQVKVDLGEVGLVLGGGGGPGRMESPKSKAHRPGITVSRSMTQMALPVASSMRMLLILVSLWVTAGGACPLAANPSAGRSPLCAGRQSPSPPPPERAGPPCRSGRPPAAGGSARGCCGSP